MTQEDSEHLDRDVDAALERGDVAGVAAFSTEEVARLLPGRELACREAADASAFFTVHPGQQSGEHRAGGGRVHGDSQQLMTADDECSRWQRQQGKESHGIARSSPTSGRCLNC